MSTFFDINHIVGRMYAGQRLIIEAVDDENGRSVIYIRNGHRVEIITPGDDVAAAVAAVMKLEG